MRYPHIVEARIRAIRSATALTCDAAVIQPNRLLVEVLVAQLRVSLQAVDRFEQQIAQLAPTLSDYDLFASFPGAGPTFAPRLLAAFGEQRDRYAGPDQIQRYAGIAPVTERSGNKCSVHWRLQCPKFLRQTVVEWAALSIPHCYWAKAYYEQQRARGSSHQAALRALAFKWIRIAFRCCQNRIPYDEATYQRRASSLLN